MILVYIVMRIIYTVCDICHLELYTLVYVAASITGLSDTIFNALCTIIYHCQQLTCHT